MLSPDAATSGLDLHIGARRVLDRLGRIATSVAAGIRNPSHQKTLRFDAATESGHTHPTSVP